MAIGLPEVANWLRAVECGRQVGRWVSVNSAADVLFGPHVALVVVDMQNDFAAAAGSLYVSGAEDLVGIVNEEIMAARDAGSSVFYTQDWHPSDTPHFAKDGGIWPVHCVAETCGAQFVAGLQVDGPVVHKGANAEDGYSGFSARDVRSGESIQTDLQDLVDRGQVNKLVVVGLATDYCVKETVLDALRLGYRVKVLLRGMRAVEVNEGDGERAIKTMLRAGAEVV